MLYPLDGWHPRDRDGDGQCNDPKPAEERRAALDLIARVRPDVLAVLETGAPPMLAELIDGLRRRGLAYGHVAHLQREGADPAMAVLSRYAISERRPHLDDRFAMGDERLPVRNGFLEVVVEPPGGRPLTLLLAQLQAKSFHALGQTDVRRNEARLLGNHVRRALREREGADVLVAGALNDTPDSAPLREIAGERGERLLDLRPCDPFGDAWTWHDRATDLHARTDYLLASPSLHARLDPARTRAVRDPLAAAASSHRPLVAVFRTSESPAETPAPAGGAPREGGVR